MVAGSGSTRTGSVGRAGPFVAGDPTDTETSEEAGGEEESGANSEWFDQATFDEQNEQLVGPLLCGQYRRNVIPAQDRIAKPVDVQARQVLDHLFRGARLADHRLRRRRLLRRGFCGGSAGAGL